MGQFGEYLKEKRLEKKYNLRKLAKELGISASYLSDLENGHRLPPSGEKEEYKHLLEQITSILELSKEEKEKLFFFADEELIKKGYMTNDMGTYISNKQSAVVALRKATDNNVDDETWNQIIKLLDGKDD